MRRLTPTGFSSNVPQRPQTGPFKSLWHSLALKLFWRDCRSGELTILVLSLVTAVATMTSIGLFTDRIKHSIFEEASLLLAADAQVRGNSPVQEEWVAKAEMEGLSLAYTTAFSAMAFAGDAMKLSQIKAVSDAYPLKGDLDISLTPNGPRRSVSHGPPPGEVWIDSSLFASLNVVVGDSLDVGEKTFRISAALIKEPDVGIGAIFSGARIMLHKSDLAATGAIQLGSRVRYRWLLEGDDQIVERFKQWLEPKLSVHHWWVEAKGSSENINSTMQRAESFLLLAGSLSVILAGIAVALAGRRYAQRQRKTVALLKTLGSTPSKIMQTYSLYLVILGVFSAVVGVLIGWFLHWVILQFVSEFIPNSLQAPSTVAYWMGGLSGLVALMAFAGPPLLSLRNIPPVVVIRNTIENSRFANSGSVLIGLGAVIALVFWYSRSVQITLVLIIGLGICVMGVSALAWILVKLAKFAGSSMTGYWRLGLANLHRHRQYNVFQIMIFAILLLLLYVLILVRTSLIQTWQEQSVDNAPNHFIYNIFPEDMPEITEFFERNGIATRQLYPLIQGRLTSINQLPFMWQEDDPEGRNRHARELGLTWSRVLAEDNKIILGQWWAEQTSADTENMKVSLEEKFASDLEIQVGDRLVMSVSGTEFSAEVSSIRSVDWGSRSPNFYMIFNQPILEGVGANWMTSFFVPDDKQMLVNELMLQFPTVTLLQLEEMLKRINGVVNQVSMAVEFILVLVLIAGFLVLVTGIQATLDERLRESAILRTLGANRALVQRSLLIEFCGIGFVAGLLATVGAQICLYRLQSQVFSMSFEPVWALFILGPVTATVLIGFIGWLSTKSVTQTPPLLTLRGLGNNF